MPNIVRSDLLEVDKESYDYIFEKNVTVPLPDGRGLIRCNVYRPKDQETPVPVLVTYGPYGKDVHYSKYGSHLYAQLNC